MDFLKILNEGRVEDFQNSYSQKFSKEQVDRIVKMFLPKYLNWVGKNLDAIQFDERLPKLHDAVTKFNTISSNLPITDLYQYKSADQLISALEDYQNKQKRVVRQVEGGNVVFENDKFFGNWMTTYSWGNDLARYSDEKFCTLTPRGKKTVNTIFKMLLDLLGVKDKGFKTMGEILVVAQYGEGVLKKWAATKSKQLGI